MPRTVDIVVSPDRTQDLVREIQKLDGVLGVRVTEGSSRRPAGDVITVLSTNTALHPLLGVLDRRGVGTDPGATITSSEPSGVIAPGWNSAVSGDSTDIPWEEMEFSLARESTMSANALLTMMAAGVFAATGVATSTLHLVLAGMVIAPGFEPIVRIMLGLVGRSPVWRRGVSDFLLGYAALFIGALVAGVVMAAMQMPVPDADATYLPRGELLTYWTTITGSSVLVSAFAGMAGAILIANNRSILTAGVMIALSLVPTMAIAGLALVSADVQLIAGALLRWAVDVGLVLAMSAGVFAWKRQAVQQRQMMM